ncbi:WG repeat-containing protein [Aureispira sp. CCB-QB1]|uniref:WG repeat-containing protein n=1 Tax=Aureispira sp. CCB-QB1 TaxID=1313421 RepID=UPI000697AB23|nr:WG repeat-containing protein [Aureispira sp. CCB-QB1]
MKSNYFLIYIVAFFLTWGCTSETANKGEANGSNGEGPITHQLDTAVGYCFQLFEENLIEAVEIGIDGNKITGEGRRVYPSIQATYYLRFEGILNGNSAEMEIYATNARDSKKTLNHRETWEIGEEVLKVKNRKIENVEGDYTFYRVACQTQRNEDSTLYDSFDGFNEDGYAVVSKNGKYGVLNKNNELTVPLFYRDLGVISEGTVIFFDEHIGMYGLLDATNGEMLVEPKYLEMMRFSEGLAAFLTEEGKWGFMNRDLEVVIKPQFFNVNFFKPDPYRKAFNEGLANVETEPGIWNYIDKTGDVVIAGDFFHTKPFENGEASVYKDNKWYFINKGGKCVKNCD